MIKFHFRRLIEHQNGDRLWSLQTHYFRRVVESFLSFFTLNIACALKKNSTQAIFGWEV